MPEGPQVRRTGNMIGTFAGYSLLDINAKSVNKDFTPLLSAEMEKIEVKGKHIFIHFDNNLILHNHMLMWGKWDLGDEPMSGRKYLSTTFTFQSGNKTGKISYYGGGVLKIITPAEMEKIKEQLGPDIMLSKREKPAFIKLRNSSLPIGEAIMEQKLISGIGNIYKSEGLFLSRLNPFKSVSKLTDNDFKKLFGVLHKQMIKDLTQPGIITVTPAKIKKGFKRYVYKRYHQKCLICGNKIERIYQGKQLPRSTYFCPYCQNVDKKYFQE